MYGALPMPLGTGDAGSIRSGRNHARSLTAQKIGKSLSILRRR